MYIRSDFKLINLFVNVLYFKLTLNTATSRLATLTDLYHLYHPFLWVAFWINV